MPAKPTIFGKRLRSAMERLGVCFDEIDRRDKHITELQKQVQALKKELMANYAEEHLKSIKKRDPVRYESLKAAWAGIA